MRIFFTVRGKIQHISALLKYSGTANTTGRCPEPRRVQARPDPAYKTAFCLSLRGLFVPMDVRSISEIAGSIYLLFRLGRSVHSRSPVTFSYLVLQSSTSQYTTTAGRFHLPAANTLPSSLFSFFSFFFSFSSFLFFFFLSLSHTLFFPVT